MKGTLLLLILLAIAGVSTAQNQKTSDSQKLKAVLDSSRIVLKADFQKYRSSVDSLNTAQYQRQLERSLGVENSKDTFYGTVFTIVAVLITFLAIFIGYNFFATARESKRQLRELSHASSKALEDQRTEFQEVLDAQGQRFDALEKQALEFQKAYQKNLQDQIAAFEERVGALKTDGNITDTRIEDLEKELARIKESNTVTETLSSRSQILKCVKCGESIPMGVKTYFTRSLGGTSFIEFVKCPHCGATNERRTFRKIAKPK